MSCEMWWDGSTCCEAAFLFAGSVGESPLKSRHMNGAVGWNIKVSKETDLALRTFLGARGMKKCDLSKFIEDAVRWRVFSRTVRDMA